MRAYLIPALCLSLAGSAASAATYYGEDDLAGAADPRPNSLAAQAAFLADAAGIGTLQPVIDFEANAVGYANPLALAPGVTATFGNDAGDPLNGVRNDDETNIGYNTTAGGDNFLRFGPNFPGAADTTATLTFSFLAPINAFGAFFTGVETDFGAISVTSSDGTVQDFALAGSTTGGGILFFGFTNAAASITSVTISNTAFAARGVRDVIGVDDIYYAATVVPEASTWALMILGIGGAGAILRARRRVVLA